MALSGLPDAFERQLKAAAANASDDIPIAIAADFLHGGAPSFARIFDRRGSKLATIQGPQASRGRSFGAGEG